VSFPFYLWSSAVAFFIFAGTVASADSHEQTIHLEQLRFARATGPLLIVAILLSLVCVWCMCGTIVSEVQLSRGIDLFYGGNSAGAFNEFERAIRWQPHNGQARFFLALCLVEKGRHREALQELLSASRVFSRQAIYVQLGRVYGRLGNVPEGMQFLDRAISMLPRDPDAWLEKGNLLYSSGDIKGASPCFQKSVSLRPGYFPAARNLAVSLNALGQTNDALRAYEHALKLSPREADLYVNMGALRARMGDAQRARALWQKALSIEPTNEMAKENLRRLERGSKNAQ
jgi:tetratricopeptide (TPR) repeat protein